MLFQVQLVNGQKQLVAISGSAAADTVQSGNLNPVTSNAVANNVTNTVTSGSTVPVSSGGVYSYVDAAITQVLNTPF